MYPHGLPSSAMLPEALLARGGPGLKALKMLLMLSGSLALLAGGIAMGFYKDWRWGLGIALFGALGVGFAGAPLSRLGGYELTTRRLTFRRYLGRRALGMPLEAIDVSLITLDADSNSISVRADDGTKIAMGCVSQFERLWGGVLVGPGLATLRVDPRGAPVGMAVATFKCRRVLQGILHVDGTAVMRPGYVAFVPDMPVVRQSVVREAAVLAANIALTLMGSGLRRVHARPPIAELLSHASGGSAEYFDAIVGLLAERLGGEVLPPSAHATVNVSAGTIASELRLEAGGVHLAATLEPRFAAWVAHLAHAFGAPL